MNVPFKITTNEKLFIVSVDQNFCEYLGVSETALLKKDFDRFVSPQCLPSFLTNTLKALHGRKNDKNYFALHIDHMEYSFEYKLIPTFQFKKPVQVDIELTPHPKRVICGSGNE